VGIPSPDASLVHEEDAMHMVIRAVVLAANPNEALEKARTVFEGITGEDKPFDYFTMFDEDGSEVSGKGRYGDVKPVLRIATKAGKAMLDEGMEATKRDFVDALANIKAGLARYTPEELFEEFSQQPNTDKDLSLSIFKHYCYQAGRYNGGSIWLYDSGGSGIRSQRDLDRLLDNYGTPIPAGEEFYIVPADVHM
jgi:hypothetical protein